jgi:antitoxin VapB
MPWLKPKEVKRFRVKLFKSGNSLAIRIPAELGFKAGAEMSMEVENGEFLSLEPVERPKRKFDVDSIWGIASGLDLIRPEDRVFEDRSLVDVPSLADDDDRQE